MTMEDPASATSRPPLCLRCRSTGHIQRECRVPRWGLCRRFGHDETQCVRSYANVTGPGRNDAIDEHRMDQADAEETAGGGGDPQGKQEKPVVSASDKCRPSKGSSEDKNNEAQDEPAAGNSTVCESAGNAVDTEGVLRQGNPGAAVLKEPCEKNDQAIAVSKRPREVTDVEGTLEQDDGGSNEGPPSKASFFRRSTLKPKPNATDAAKATGKTQGSVETPDMDATETNQGAASLMAGKRPHEEIVGVKQQPGEEGGEPPPKAQENLVVPASDKCRPSKGSSEDKDNEAQDEPAAEDSTLCESAGNAVHTEGVLRQDSPDVAVLKESCEKNDQAIAVSKTSREIPDEEGIRLRKTTVVAAKDSPRSLLLSAGLRLSPSQTFR
ncbi:hypothetical protein HPB49_012181 [Dermacentor silvarum]|uniref:Uncharacterized protein n=1 Tax=Dermacentor silvarum TaxID=543639 RepID=A0ACB8DZI0_DERSI|nr:hypothetical protein HPB49_012181 [Dermacentor silvarum]